MVVGIVLAVVAVVVVFVMLGRMQNARKKEAIADLAREREALHTPDILELVHEEVQESGIAVLPGAEGIDPTVLLKVWKRDRNDCPEGHGRFVIADHVAVEEATENSVTYECNHGEDEI